MKHRWSRAIAAVGIGGALSLAAPALPAVGSHSPPSFAHDVEVGDDATLVAKGAGVIVPVEVTCGPGGTGFVNVEVSQARGRHVANGWGSVEDVTCDGTTQVVDVVVNAQTGAFKRGSALVEAQLYACPADFSSPCQRDTDVEEVSVSGPRP